MNTEKSTAATPFAAPSTSLDCAQGDDRYSMYDIDDLTNSSLRLSRILFATIGAFMLTAIAWAWFATLDESVNGTGKVVASSNNKRIQNHEGGIISEILVEEGQEVRKGESLLQLDPLQFQARYQGQQSEYYDKLAKVTRLEAESEGLNAIPFPKEIIDNKPETVASQTALLQSRLKDHQATRQALLGEVQQKRQEFKELQNKLEYQRTNYRLIKRELEMTRPLAGSGAVSEIDLLKLERQYSEAFGRAQDSRLALPKVKAALVSAEHRVAEHDAKRRSDILKELNEARAELASLKEALPALKDRVSRTLVRSPVDGIVKRIFVHTIGESIPPGRDLMEIVPKEDNLLVVAKISPRDIAFIHPDQKANVRITAYDFSIYGSLEGNVENISADAIVDPADPKENNGGYYEVKIRTKSSTLLTKGGKVLPIIPGMVAEIDVLTGKKTVLEYILKPIIKTTQYAFTER